MKIGKYDKRVIVEKRLEVQADSGEVQHVYSRIENGERWAYIEMLQGREYFAARQDQNTVSTEIGLRYAPEITEKMRIVYTPDSSKPGLVEIYTIESVIHVEYDRRETRLMCTKRIAEGYKRDGSNA